MRRRAGISRTYVADARARDVLRRRAELGVANLINTKVGPFVQQRETMQTFRRNFVMAIIGALGLVSGKTFADGETETQRLMRTHATERYNVAVPGFKIRAGGGMTMVNAGIAHVRQTVT